MIPSATPTLSIVHLRHVMDDAPRRSEVFAGDTVAAMLAALPGAATPGTRGIGAGIIAVSVGGTVSVLAGAAMGNFFAPPPRQTLPMPVGGGVSMGQRYETGELAMPFRFRWFAAPCRTQVWHMN